ncbi:hypothetical protein SAMN06265222_10898 [Neorhodopirellula lusitana]|uniref:Flagellar protein FlgN n=1 Tax=Neorhodopirellula lusitana TaxID=445327 RepID=A0ABY1QA31_9BACT|nr:hypothetical protein [Neorhodopirellula lusitana]SMP63533.1 hypothetical protein SAMN06265222_10898 [Neorhodopirellula lusitana]
MTQSPKSDNASSSPAQPWRNRVEEYVEQLAQVAEKIDLILDETRVHTMGLRSDEVDASTAQLMSSISELEDMVQRREELLRADDAPEAGLSLSEKLLYTRKIEDARLARRCGEVAEAIATTHQRATALFVCQYHLSDFQRDLLNRLAGATGPQTYNRQGQTPQGGSGLFNEAA